MIAKAVKHVHTRRTNMSSVKPLPLLFGELIVTSLSSRNGFLDTGRILPLFFGLEPAGAGEVARLRKGLLEARLGCKLFGEGCRSVRAKRKNRCQFVCAIVGWNL